MNHLHFLQSYRNKKILIAPLNWGLGHATRCVPIIDALRKYNEVIIASDGIALRWMQQQYPDLVTKELPGYDISYDSEHMWLNMLRSSPRLIDAIRGEHQLLQSWIAEESIDLVISDHRLGLYTNQCSCVVIAHQITIPHGNSILRGMISSINKGYLNRYDQVWIPDYEDRSEALAGDMSVSHGLHAYDYIMPLSRLEKKVVDEKNLDVLIILSGPEPSRTLLENNLIKVIETLAHDYRITIIRGLDGEDISVSDHDVEVISLADTLTLNDRMNRAKLVICRAGYSSIMDLHLMDKNAVLIPTPSQPEQEYLATHLQTNDNFRIMVESDVGGDLMTYINEALQS